MKVSIAAASLCCSVLIFLNQAYSQQKYSSPFKPAMSKRDPEQYNTRLKIQNRQQLDKKLCDAVKAGTNLNYKEKLPKPQQYRTDKDLTVLEYAYEIKKMCDSPDNLKKSEEIISIIEAKLNKKQ